MDDVGDYIRYSETIFLVIGRDVKRNVTQIDAYRSNPYVTGNIMKQADDDDTVIFEVRQVVLND